MQRRRRMGLKQAQASQRIRERADQAPAQVDQAMLSLLEFDPRGVVHGENVAQMGEVIRGQAHAMAASFLERFRSRAAGIIRPREGMENVVRELFGEGTKDANAKAMAEGVSNAFAMLRSRYNVAGGDIGKRADWGLPQGHDKQALALASKDDWIAFTMDRVDPNRMLDDFGEPVGIRQLQGALDRMYDDIVTGGLSEITPIDENSSIGRHPGRYVRAPGLR